MAGASSNIKEEMELTMKEDLDSGNHGPSQEQLLMAEMMERGIRSLGFGQRKQKADPKPSGSASPLAWSPAPPRNKKTGPPFRVPRETSHGDVPPPLDFTGAFQGLKFRHERNPDLDMLAEIGLEELNGLEMEVMRRQMSVITERLRALEDQGATWHYRETIFFTIVVSACLANLWLWMRH
ncbi:fetal and adult testis-expressed transcript protein [Erinaceus europaeus]|uniref:Fetal and adult testis-expressed transcript protein n=1 Tax=Erinaceus europaeus TaxID=9365 RepID=A0ABM3WPJ8_ERIEU|nr:fetal and adult testis-expressed transcript protein [Erinaceus europaeus]